jgi:hypothetical protein
MTQKMPFGCAGFVYFTVIYLMAAADCCDPKGRRNSGSLNLAQRGETKFSMRRGDSRTGNLTLKRENST